MNNDNDNDNDDITAYSAARERLVTRRSALIKELKQIEEILGPLRAQPQTGLSAAIREVMQRDPAKWWSAQMLAQALPTYTRLSIGQQLHSWCRKGEAEQNETMFPAHFRGLPKMWMKTAGSRG